jgi:hypothetical protein
MLYHNTRNLDIKKRSKSDDPQNVMDFEWPEMGMYYIISY